ncbi:sterol desaturase family protein [Eudoraea sp.]|uniref:sterol desaturase family protein n=1 Tax=Eudoraea sp. TaxID=1979955 RepID=UPI003C78574B
MTLFEEVDFNSISFLVILTLLIAEIILIRYLIISGAYHFLFYKFLKKQFNHRILDHKPYKQNQLLKEIYWSAISGLIFAAFGVFMYYLWTIGVTSIYTEFAEYPLWYIPISIGLLLFIQDTYYYWIHRWMHLPSVYRYFHKIHHKSIHSSVLTSFSFHPLETFLQILILPVIIIFLPLHLYTLIFTLLLMTLSATINHAGVEIYPKGGVWDIFSKWVIGATHHDHHHRKFNYNYGLYFTFWDIWMHTEYEEKKEKKI